MNRFNLTMKLFGYDISKANKQLDKIINLSKDEFRIWKKSKRWEIARFHYENNKFFRKKVGNSFPKKWADIPIMNKTDYQRDISSLLSNNFSVRSVYISNTSGSSGHPFFFAKDKDAHALTWAYMKRRYSKLGILENDLEARFYGIPLDRYGYLLEKVKDILLNRFRFPVFDLSDSKLNGFINTFAKKKFKYIYGYTNSILCFSKFIIKHNIDIDRVCPTLKLVIVTSEVCTDEDRVIIETAFSVPVFNEYGASEFNYIGYDNRKGGWKICKEMVFLETNKDGELLVTDLHNKAFPFIRYNIGDIVEIDTNSQDEPYIDNLVGRTNDTIVLPSGKIAPGLSFYYISKSLLESSGQIKEFVIRQVELDRFIFDIVSDRDITNKEKMLIKENMDIYLEPNLSFEVLRVDYIKRDEMGKIKHFFSELNVKKND